MNEPKVLIWDIETAGVNALNADLSAVVCFGYKWLGEREAHVLTIDNYRGWFKQGVGLNDRPLLVDALEIMADADLLVAHYGDRFDKPFFAGRCIIHGLTPPPPTKQRDTWYIAYKNFKFSSNRLANLADILGLGQKKYRKSVPDEWPGWWHRALAGDRVAIAEMAKYCAQDVQTLEQVYLRLRPYDQPHPRLYYSDGNGVCGRCGGHAKYRGIAYVSERRYRRLRCSDCGRWSRESKPIKP